MITKYYAITDKQKGLGEFLFLGHNQAHISRSLEKTREEYHSLLEEVTEEIKNEYDNFSTITPEMAKEIEERVADFQLVEITMTEVW